MVKGAYWATSLAETREFSESRCSLLKLPRFLVESFEVVLRKTSVVLLWALADICALHVCSMFWTLQSFKPLKWEET